MSTSTISPKELYEKIKSRAAIPLIDVRTPIEFQEVHVRGARNVPLDTLEPEKLFTNPGAKDAPLAVMCRSGGRAANARERLLATGFTNVFNVEGGMLAWEAAELPVVRDREVISLERQIRIAAGTLVLIGSLLGLFAHPYWFVLPAFVGAGLIFAGVTNTCGMGMLLAKMPWNRAKPGTTTACESGSCAVRK